MMKNSDSTEPVTKWAIEKIEPSKITYGDEVYDAELDSQNLQYKLGGTVSHSEDRLYLKWSIEYSLCVMKKDLLVVLYTFIYTMVFKFEEPIVIINDKGIIDTSHKISKQLNELAMSHARGALKEITKDKAYSDILLPSI